MIYNGPMFWTPMDLSRLTNLVRVNEDPPDVAARKLGRELHDVLQKARELGLQWHPRWAVVVEEVQGCPTAHKITDDQNTFNRSNCQ